MKRHILAAGLALVATGSYANDWTLNAAASKLAFGSIKKDTVGEVHSFETISGSVDSAGNVTLDIDLASLETYIDIRNERMIEHVFKNAPKATVSAQIDMSGLNGLAVGANDLTDFSGTLSFLGNDVDIEAEMFVLRVSEGQVMVSTNDMIFVSTEDLGINAGIDVLQGLASLPGITRTVPVTLRLMFDQSGDQAAAPAAAETVQTAAISGDAKAGKKVFRKCRACHKLDEGKNAVGPNLYQIVGRASGAVDGFKYSKAMKEANLVWTPEALADYLANPKKSMPGTKMAFAGVKKESDLENLIAYLADQ